MPQRKGLLAPQNTFLDTIANRFDGTHSNFVLGNAQVPAIFPIVYCSDGFCELTGFSRAQIMQKGVGCSFLYGLETPEDAKEKIEDALKNKVELKLEVILYKKNETSFWCLLDIVPIKNEKHEVVLFLASHKDITKTKMAEMEEEMYDEEDPLAGNFSIFVPFRQTTDHMATLDPETCIPNSNYHRRRSRAVLYQLSGHYRQDKIKPKLKLNNNLLRSTSLPEYKTAAIKKSKFILSHYGVFKTCWDWLILIATFYVAIMVPYSAAFRDTNISPSVNRTIITDVIVEALFIIDIVINFRTTFVNKKGEVVAKPKSIAIHYLRGWFLVDLLAAMPFDLLYVAHLYNRDTSMHLLKLTRLLRLARLLQKMDRYSQYSAIILTLLMLMFSLVSHWLACIWYVIALEEIEVNPVDWDVGWLHELSDKIGVDIVNFTDTATAYVTALYFTTSSLTSVGFGNVSANTNAEKVFSILTMLIGALMHAVVFGNVTAIIQRMYSRRSQYQTKLRDLKDFFRLHQISKELRQRMLDYFQTTWALNNGIDPNEILREFPDELRGDVSMHLNKEMLSLPIFEPAPQGCLKQLAHHIKSNFCAPGEYLVHTGDALSYLYLVCNGSMEVLQNGMVVAILGKGDLVGCDIMVELSEVILKSTSDVKALTYCDLKSIYIPGLREVLKLYPEFAESFTHDILLDLTFNLREGFDTDEEDMTNGTCSLALHSISEDDENDSSDDADQVSLLLSPTLCTPIKTGVSHSFQGDEMPWDCSSDFAFQQTRSSMAERAPPNYDKVRPVATHPNIGRTLELYELHDELQIARNNLGRLDAQMESLTKSVVTLSDDVRVTLTLVRQLTTHSRSGPLHTHYQDFSQYYYLSKSLIQSSSQPTGFSVFQSSVDQKTRLRVVSKTTQTDHYLQNDLSNEGRKYQASRPNSGYPSSSSNDDKVRLLIGNGFSVTKDDDGSISDDSVFRNSGLIKNNGSSSKNDGLSLGIFSNNGEKWNREQVINVNERFSPRRTLSTDL
ncbi:potassium voltage-gated channel subfamily H member 8-like [Limulus polyphemus]|uniref:Potassium voltage-gated channel subfamily H member 8-like n=1 Tax=Limulus polyphemus TaxID=6850 RepID=A0ABM1SSP6_LIMPO|nr:potassium voltage-gated channel subfamily H member 8-like [Limulus polyphemus]XP_022246651.1 potassium voltage-gated channel subfamily H member 8-like [Limulus polyphemus]XP_022246652.1 potassium voltage-gated channel subfamily H member 8-like [Limulus polyphemus]